MMSINENQPQGELKGNIQINSNRFEASNTAKTTEGSTFKDEFSKLADNTTSQIDTSMIASALGLYQAAPINTYTPSLEEEFDSYLIDTKTIDNKDAMFFLNISSQGENVNIKLNNDTSIIDASSYKTMEVSKTLGDIIMKSAENNKSVRLDFDNRVTVVLKVSKEGKIDASFFPQDKQVEQYLRNNIDYLKVRFDEQNIAYSNISYRPYRQNRNNRQGDKNE